MTYEIFEGNMERLSKKLTTISNKCAKYGCEFHFEELGESFRNVKDEATGEVRTARFITVDVSGKAQISSWEFIATIEHSKPVNIIRSFRPEVEIPEHFYTVDTYCEHCKTRRYRKDTYIVRNTETGEFKQVGKSCLKDFTGGLSAEQVASYISWFDEVIKGEYVEPGFKSYDSTEEVLQFAVESVRLYGFTKTEAYAGADSTRDVVCEQLHQYGRYSDRIIRDGFDPDHKGNAEKTKAIVAWVESLPEQFGYISNLKATMSRPYCERRDIGIICSAVASYNREMEYQARKAVQRKQASNSQWVGNEGDRIELHNLQVRLLTSWDTMYGMTYLYKFIDEQGNTLTWKTGKWLGVSDEITPDLRISLKGTIKKHSEFNHELQTELTRCTVI